MYELKLKTMVRMGRCIILVMLCLFGRIQAQEDVAERYLEVRGVSELEMEPLPGATANLYEGGSKVKSIKTGSDGSFSFRLEINKQYTIEIEKDGLISKRISFNTTMPDEEKGAWMNEFSMGLLRSCSGVDYSVLKEPVDKVSFDSKRREFVSDKQYVTGMRSRIENMMMKNDQCLLDSYESAIKKGDQLVAQKKFDEAIAAYKEADAIFPTETLPDKKIAEINSQVNKQQNSAEVYQKIVEEADALASQQRYPEAIQKYKSAAKLNPQDSYPNQKITEIENSLANKEAERQAFLNTEDKYNQAMAKASVAYTRKDYASAKQYYQQALEIKPDESVPKTRMQEIETVLAKKAADDAARAADATQKAAFENEYKALIAMADEQFKAKKFDEARQNYAKAMNMKPSESYPAQRVKTIENAVASEQAALQKSKEDGYAAAMAAANKALAQNQFPLAKENYQKALSFKPGDVSAGNQLTQVDRQEEEYAKRKSVEDQYKKTVATADAFLQEKDLAKAKDAYNQALALKPGDQYAQTKITAIDNTIAAEQASLQKSKNDGYNAAVSAGNNALAQNQFSLAKESYQKALSFKPDDQYARNRITETDRLADDYAKKKSLEDQYRKVIETADGFLKNKELAKAKENYVQALALVPGDQYAQSKITSIDNTIAAEQAARYKATEEGYKAAIGAANTAITQKSYTQAKEFLLKALSIKPGDAYATGRSAEVDKLIEDQRKIKEQEQLQAKQYSEAVAQADRYFNDRDYSSAKASYNKALQIKPGDSYANQKIASIDELLAAELAQKQKKTEDSFKNAMDRGTGALISKDYAAAKGAFQEALAIKPSDNSAKIKLAEAETLIKQAQEKLAAEQTRKRKYDETIQAADQLLNQKNYVSAKSSYEQALDIMPGEVYPRQKLEEVTRAIAEQERLLAEKQATENAYNLALANADKYFKAKDYNQAKDEYTRALNLKPDEVLPKNKLAETERLIQLRQKEQADAKARADAYTAAMNAGNELYVKKDYASAKTNYAEALKLMPGDVLASDQIKKIDYILAEAQKLAQAEATRKASYEALIKSADLAYDAGKYPSAKENYKKALTLEPTSTYAKQRIARIDEISRVLTQAKAKTGTEAETAKPRVSAAIPMNELNFRTESEKQKYLAELKLKYPEGVTLEKYKEQYKETFRYIIIRDNQAQEFRHVRFTTYSGAQYSFNGKPITQQYFLSQTKLRQGESFQEMDMQ